jgi:DNA-binding response OmpR family regulator
MKRRVLLVDDEVAVLLTLKAVLEINGFTVDTAASAREGRLKLRSSEYDMVISDLKMETDKAGSEVIAAARSAPNRPAVALLTAFPLADEDWQEMGADHMLVKPVHTRRLLEQIDWLLDRHTHTLAAEAATANPGDNTEPQSKKRTAKNGSSQPENALPENAPLQSAGRKTPAKTANKRSAQIRA